MSFRVFFLEDQGLYTIASNRGWLVTSKTLVSPLFVRREDDQTLIKHLFL